MALAHGEAQPFEYIRWKMAERFGWTLEYIDELPLAEIQRFLQVEDGTIKAMNQKQNKGR